MLTFKGTRFTISTILRRLDVMLSWLPIMRLEPSIRRLGLMISYK